MTSFFGYEVKPNTAGRHQTPEGFVLKLTQIALAATAKKGEAVRFKVTVEDLDESENESFVVAVLIAGKHESQSINLAFGSGEVTRFEVIGSTSVHITGYYEEEQNDFMNLHDEEDGEGIEEDGEDDITPEELAFLREKFVMSSSEEESEEEQRALRFEEIHEEEDESSEESDNEVVPTVSEKKKHSEPQINYDSKKRKRHEGSDDKRNKKRKKNRKH